MLLIITCYVVFFLVSLCGDILLTNRVQSDLQTEFRAVPQPVQGIAGGSVVMECQAPRGHPEPQIRWKKNGQPLELDLDLGVDSDR